MRVGKRLRQIVHKRQMRITDANDLAWLQMIVVMNSLAIDQRAVAAVQIAQHPLPLRLKDLSMIPATPLVLDDDSISRSAPDRDGLAVHQTENIRPFRAF